MGGLWNARVTRYPCRMREIDVAVFFFFFLFYVISSYLQWSIGGGIEYLGCLLNRCSYWLNEIHLREKCTNHRSLENRNWRIANPHGLTKAVDLLLIVLWLSPWWESVEHYDLHRTKGSVRLLALHSALQLEADCWVMSLLKLQQVAIDVAIRCRFAVEFGGIRRKPCSTPSGRCLPRTVGLVNRCNLLRLLDTWASVKEKKNELRGENERSHWAIIRWWFDSWPRRP